MSTIHAVLFDLDGTLVDTAPDLAYALNTVMQEQGLSPLAYAKIRPVASHGAVALLALGFNITPTDLSFDPLRQRLLDIYAANLSRETRLFEGMEAVLQQLETRNIPWGIVTNKPAFLTDPLCEQLGLTARTNCIVSADTTPHSKPHPAPMLHACKLIGHAPENCLYIGDAARDIEAGNNVNMTTLIASWGYLADDDTPEDWQADGMIDQANELLTWL
jgi:phosphoglycolate phosphatase